MRVTLWATPLIALLAAAVAAPEPPPAARKLTRARNTYPFRSPDGTKIAFESDRNGNLDIYVMNADGTGVTRLTDHPAADRKPAWSPDGKKIVFQSQRDGNEEIYAMNVDGTGQVNLTRNPADENHPYWSADGSRIVFNSNRDAGETDEVYAMQTDGDQVQRITRNDLWDTYAALSPDGSKLVVRRMLPHGGARPDGTNSEIFVMDADGRNEVNLTRHPSFDGYPAWSPDGKRIAFASDRTGFFQIWVMAADGTGLRSLTPDQKPGQQSTKPNWSSDGRRILYARGEDEDVHIYEVDVLP